MLVSDVGFQGRINLVRRGAGRVCVSEFLWVSMGILYMIYEQYKITVWEFMLMPDNLGRRGKMGVV